MTTYSVFKDYFDLLEETLTKYELKDKPVQIYNCNESGMPLEFKLSKVIAGKGVKKVRQCISGNITPITILACANAAGQAVPPMVIFSGKILIACCQKGRCQIRFTECLKLDGWIRNTLQSGSCTIFLNTQFLVDL